MIKMVHSILKFSGRYAGRIRTAYIFSFLKSICSNAPVFIAVIVLNLLMEGDLDISGCCAAAAALLVFFGLTSVFTNLSDRFQSTAGYEMIALVGESGSGKTTIANLLARFWDISSGSVKIRGTDVRQLPAKTLMEHLSMVFQKVYLFEDTVYNNIAMGRPGATREEVVEAARKARCYDFIMRLPYGFETVLSEGGASLSGGERQRISIARCILKDAPIVILDEATASVDADNEAAIHAAMSELCRNKTILVIAHRLNTIRGADRILVIDRGKIAESGTHEVLMEKPGIYRHLAELQSGMNGEVRAS